MLYGVERIAHPEDGAMPTVALLAAGTLVGWLAVRHLARAKNPLLDLSAFKVQTFAISTLSAGTHFPGRHQRHAIPVAAAVPGRLRPETRRCRHADPCLFPRQSRNEDGDDTDAEALRFPFGAA
jgi:hypothetical protein